MLTRRSLARAGCAIAAAFAACLLAAEALADEFTGAGATFPAPIYTRWSEQYASQSGDTLNYQAIGSGAGVNQIINRTVDFGASDTPVPAERLAANSLVQFPAIIGGVVVTANVPGVDANNLRLTGELVGDIYLGRVRLWNDRRIADLNPGVTLPALAIAPVYRADSSGTTNIFTSYVAAVSEAFRATMGVGNAVSWRVGIGAPGNAGVAGVLRNTRGAIGYVEYAYATENNLQTPQLRNRAGQWVRPSVAAFSAAAATADWNNAQNFAVNMINAAGAASWPIVGATYILAPRNPADRERARRVVQFFDWAFRNGQPAADQLHYITLPRAVQERIRREVFPLLTGER